MFVREANRNEGVVHCLYFEVAWALWTNFQRWHLICVPIITHLGMTLRTCVDGTLHFQGENQTFWASWPGNPRHYVSIKDLPAGILCMPEYLWHHPVQIYSTSLVVFGKYMWPVCLLVLWMVNHEDSWARGSPRENHKQVVYRSFCETCFSLMHVSPHFCLCALLLLLLLQPLSCAEILYIL